MKNKQVLKSLAIMLLFSLLFHGFFLFTNYIFALGETDSLKQDLYFIPFLQKAFLSGNVFWSWAYGLGGNVFGEFSFYYTTSPFFYLMLLIKAVGIGSWDFVNLLQWKLAFSILKQCLSMLFIFLLLRYEGRRIYTSLIGALTYGGSIFFMLYALADDFMTDAYVWLPLTILGLSIYRKTKKPWIMLLGFVLSLINSFYFGYMDLIFYAVVVLVFTAIDGKTAKERAGSFLKYIGNYLFYVLLSIGLASIALVPAISAYLSCDRLAKHYHIPLMNAFGFFMTLPEKLFLNIKDLGFPLVILIVLFLPWKRFSPLAKRKTILAGICFLFYIIPFFSSAFNGFSYMTDRWYYIFIFAVAYALPEWLEENDKKKIIGYGFLIFTYLLVLLLYFTRPLRGLENNLLSIINPVILILGCVSLLALALKKYTRDTKRIARLEHVFMGFMALSLVVNGVFYSACAGSQTVDTFRASKIQTTDDANMYTQLTPNTNDFYRTISRDAVMENDSLNYGYYGAATYNSLVNSNLYEWIKRDFNILGPYVNFSRFQNFDDQLFLESAFGVKYMTTKKSDDFIPYGFILKAQTANDNIYENQYPLGIDSWYESAVSADTFHTWNIAQRDAMLLQTSVLPGSLSESYRQPSAPDITTQLDVDWSKLKLTNATYKDGVLYAKSGAIFELPIRNICKDQCGEILVQMNLKPQDGRAFRINVNGKETLKTEESGKWTYPIDDYTFRVEENTDTLKCTITAGNYKINSFNTWFNSYDQYKNAVNALNKYNLENLYVKSGLVRGTFENKTKGILAFSIPYCNGWTASVNGKSQKIIKVNGAFSGLLLDPGNYTIAFRYETPGLKAGAMVSAVSLLLFLILIIRSRRKRRSV